MQNLYFTELLIFSIRFQFPGHKGDFAQPEPDPNIYVVNLMGNLITFSSYPVPVPASLYRCREVD